MSYNMEDAEFEISQLEEKLKAAEADRDRLVEEKLYLNRRIDHLEGLIIENAKLFEQNAKLRAVLQAIMARCPNGYTTMEKAECEFRLIDVFDVVKKALREEVHAIEGKDA